MVKIGRGAPVRTAGQEGLKMFLLGLLMGDGWALENAVTRSEDVTRCLVSGYVLDEPVVGLTDGRLVRAWAEGV